MLEPNQSAFARHELTDIDSTNRTAWCSQCDNLVKVYWQSHRGNWICSIKKRQDNRLAKYNLTARKYKQMLLDCDNSCNICGGQFTDENRPCIDHDHSCCPGANSCGNCVRGLLCAACNMALGSIEKYREHLKTMLEFADSKRE